MNKYILTLVLVLSAFLSKAQTPVIPIADSVKKYLDTSFEVIKKNALNRNTVDWDALRQTLYNKAAGAQTYEDIIPLYPYIFEQINDHHGALKYRSKTYGWSSNLPKINKTVSDAVRKYTEVRSEKIGKDIGYIMIPGNNDFGNKKIDTISKSIKEALSKINTKQIKGWIIDLRSNTGGNMYPMMAGLSDLLGDGKLGGFITYDHKPDGSWTIKNKTLYIDSTKVSSITYAGYPIKSNMPIVVLIGSYTASSGEMTTISMIGRAKTILLGEPSAGYTTVNEGFKLNSYSGLNLAVDYATDRNGITYPHKLSPNIVVADGDDFENLSNDKKVQAAVQWIKKLK